MPGLSDKVAMQSMPKTIAHKNTPHQHGALKFSVRKPLVALAVFPKH